MDATENPGTRDRLIRAAVELLWERSYQGAGIEEICVRARARKGSFYHYFPSKTDLAIAAVEATWEQVRGEVFGPLSRRETSGLRRLRSLAEAVDGIQAAAREKAGSYLGCPFGGLGQEMAHQDERLRVVLEEVFRGHCEFIQDALETSEAAGEIPPGDNSLRARKVFALFEGALLLAKVANDPAVFLDVVASVPEIAAS